MKNHYFKTKVVKMGKWALLPSDSEVWHGEHTSKYFKQLFGVDKGTLALHTLDDGYQHVYFPQNYFKKFYKQITKINAKE